MASLAAKESMPTSSVGRASSEAGITLIEIVVVVAVTISLRSMDPNFVRKLELPEGVHIEAEERDEPRRFLLFPGGTVPRISIPLVNRRGTRRIVQVDPITGVPQIQTPRTNVALPCWTSSSRRSSPVSP